MRTAGRQVLRAFAIAVAVAALAGGCSVAGAPRPCAPGVRPYASAIAPGAAIRPLLAVGDRLPLTRDPSRHYQMVGIPDGLGAHRDANDRSILHMSHELTRQTVSEPIVGAALDRGAIVSRLVLDRRGCPLSGDRAYSTVYDEERGLVLPAPTVDNATPAFSRFCSGSLAWREAGFDRAIYLTGEESDATSSFDGKGGLAVAVFDDELHTLPRMGRFSRENALVQPTHGARTVVILTEDGPAKPDSQLYLYVGTKDPSAGTVLRRNGLDNGTLYVWVALAPGMATEKSFQSGSIEGRWAAIAGAETMTDVELERACDTAGAFGFIRPEDGAFSKTDPNDFYFVTTGGATGNQLGRLYQLRLDPEDPTRGARLTIVSNADQVVAAGGDTAISPDNVDTSAESLLVCEDATAQSRPIMTAKGRDASIWRFDLADGFAATRVAQVATPGRDGVAVPTGTWESSGILHARDVLHRDAWLFDVQAHPPTTPPASNTVEDGQLLLLELSDP